MSGTVKVFKNMLSLLSERVLVPIVNLLIVICIARYMGSDGLGRFSVVVGFVSFFDIFLDLGINTLIIREVSKDRMAADRYASKAMTLKLAAYPIVLLAITVFVYTVGYPHDMLLSFYIFSAAFLLTALSDTYGALYKAWERMEYLALVAFISQAALLVLVVVAARSGYGVKGIALANLAVGGCTLVFNYFFFNLKVGKVRPGIDRKFHVNLFEHSLPFITLGFFFIIFYRIDVVLISTLKGDSEAGFFSVASKLTASLLLLSAVFLEAVFPIISKYEHGAREMMRTAVKDSFHLLSMVSFPIAAGLVMTGDGFIRIMFGPGFEAAAPVLAVLSLAIPLAYLSSSLHYVAMAREMQKRSFWGIISLIAVSAVFCYVLIGMYGGMGAAYATLGLAILVFLFLSGLVFSDIGGWSSFYEVIRPLIASAVMAAFLYFISGVNVVPRALMGGIVYAVALWIIRGVNERDFERFREIKRHFMPAQTGDKGAL